MGHQGGKQRLLIAEALEQRSLFASVSWDGGAGTTLWTDAANWSADALPTAADDVNIDMPGDGMTVTIPSGAHAIASLLSSERLIVSGGTLEIGTSSSLNDGLIFEAGTLRVTGTLSIDGSFDWHGGTFGRGTLRLESGTVGTLLGDATKVLAGRLENFGDLTYAGANFMFGSTSIPTTVGVLSNNAGAVFRVDSANTIRGASLSAGNAILNAGIFEKVGASTTAVEGITVTNDGTIALLGGGLRFLRGGSTSKPLNVPLGRTLELSGFALGAPLNGEGDVIFSGTAASSSAASHALSGLVTVAQGATLTLNASTTFSRLTLVGGQISGAGDLSISSSLTWSDTPGRIPSWSAMNGSGTTTVESGAKILIAGGTLMLGRSLVNRGTADWTVGGGFLLGAGGALVNHGIIDVATTLANPPAAIASSNGTAAFTNSGSFVHRGSSPVQISATWTNNGSFAVRGTGELQFLTRQGVQSGSIHIDAGSAVRFSQSVTYLAGSAITGEGRVVLAGGLHTIESSTFGMTGTTELAGATVTVGDVSRPIDPNIRGAVTFTRPIALHDATLAGTVRFNAAPVLHGKTSITGVAFFDVGVAQVTGDSLVISNKATFAGTGAATFRSLTLAGTLTTPLDGFTITESLTTRTATIDGPGAIAVGNGATWTHASAPFLSTLTLRTTLQNFGSATFAGGATLRFDGGRLLQHGTLTVAEVSANGTSFAPTSSTSSGSVQNTGLIRLQHTGQLTVLVPLTNSGSIVAASGTLEVAALTNAALIELSAGTSLRLNGASTFSADGRIVGAGDVEFLSGEHRANASELANTGRLLFSGDAAVVTLDRPVTTGEARIRGSLTFNEGFTSTAASLTSNGNLSITGPISFGGGITFERSSLETTSTVMLHAPHEIALDALTIGSVVFTSASDVSVAGTLKLYGTLGDGGGEVRATSTAATYLWNATIAGTLIMDGSVVPSTTGATWRSSYIYMAGGTLVNRGSWLLNRNSDEVLIRRTEGSGGERIINQGTIVVTGESASLVVEADLINEGSIHVASRYASVSLRGRTAQHGHITSGTGGSLGINGESSYGVTSTMSGAGEIYLAGGSHSLRAANLSNGGKRFFGLASNAYGPTVVRILDAATFSDLTIASNVKLHADQPLTLGGDSSFAGSFSGADLIVSGGTLTAIDATFEAGTGRLLVRSDGRLAFGTIEKFKTGNIYLNRDLINEGSLGIDTPLATGIKQVIVGDATLTNHGYARVGAPRFVADANVPSTRRHAWNHGTLDMGGIPFSGIPLTSDGVVNVTSGTQRLEIGQSFAGVWNLQGELRTLSPVLVNEGTINVTQSTGGLGTNASWLRENRGTIRLPTYGALFLTPGGDSNATFLNGGTIAIGRYASVTINGSFTAVHGADSGIDLTYVTPDIRGRLNVTKRLTVDPAGTGRSTLTISTEPTTLVTPGTQFDLITAGEVVGTFDEYQ